jgi:hypothetical protein
MLRVAHPCDLHASRYADGTRSERRKASVVAVDVWLFTGIPGAGKTTTARRLAERLGRGVHLEGDLLQTVIASGAVWPGQEPEDEAERQIRLNVRNQCLLARSYRAAGFTPVLDYVVVSRSRLAEYEQQLAPLRRRARSRWTATGSGPIRPSATAGPTSTPSLPASCATPASGSTTPT